MKKLTKALLLAEADRMYDPAHPDQYVDLSDGNVLRNMSKKCCVLGELKDTIESDGTVTDSVMNDIAVAMGHPPFPNRYNTESAKNGQYPKGFMAALRTLYQDNDRAPAGSDRAQAARRNILALAEFAKE